MSRFLTLILAAIAAFATSAMAEVYEYDINPSDEPQYLSVDVPDGNYLVTVTLGSKKKAGETTVRAESRRLFLENVPTKKGESKEYSFVVNKRNRYIQGGDSVRIKPREYRKLNWDDKLTIEINGKAPVCSHVRIEPAPENITTVYLCGNSTVVDQDDEPWASWGQMIPRWFDTNVAIANYAESGESASNFIGVKRLKKILSLIKPGDYLFVEFGHNDQKQKMPGAGAYYNFSTALKTYIDEARSRGAIPVFVTPTQRRSFDESGHIKETHADYPEAMEAVARREGVPVIDLHSMTRTFYETMGVEPSKRAFVHYPANTYPGQDRVLADNTHFNPYGAYQIAKMVIEGMRKANLPLAEHIIEEYQTYDPRYPDSVDEFFWAPVPSSDVTKPDGN